MKTFVVIPAHNEERHIAQVISETRKYCSNVVVVDDGSRDRTLEEAKNAGVTVLRHAINLGKGAALRTGTEYSIRHGAEAIVFIDSDGQHSPADIPRLLKELEGADVVFTYRNLKSEHMPLTKKFGNMVLNTLLKLLFGIRIIDTQCGFKAMTSRAYRTLRLMSSDYNIESEIAAKTGKYGLRFRQAPIETIYKDRYKGTTPIDGVKIAMMMLWWKFSR